MKGSNRRRYLTEAELTKLIKAARGAMANVTQPFTPTSSTPPAIRN